MSALDLLPSNATRLERDVSRSADFLPTLGPKTERIRDAKRTDIPDDVVPWLIYEYGLGEITPYVPDLRQALDEGIQWQRLRGTRRAIDIGLGWIGFDATVEESEQGTLRWADFQMGLDQAPNGLEFTNNVIQISRLSAPIRSRLFRIYGGYDHRRFRLDDHALSGGSWLADDTGVYLREDWPQLSFGREFHDTANLRAGASANLGIERARTDGGIYEDRMILSTSQLDELVWEPWHMDAERVTVSRGHLTIVGPWWQPPTYWAQHSWDQGLDWAGLVNRIAPPSRYAKAGIYLSDGAILSDTNTCFPARFEEEIGAGAFLLSEGDTATGEGLLSEHKQRVQTVEWLERIDRIHPVTVQAAADTASALTLSREHQRVLPYDDTFRLDQHLLSDWAVVQDVLFKDRLHIRDLNLAIGIGGSVGGLEYVSRISEAGIYLDEGAALGDTAAVLAFEFDQRFERLHQVVSPVPHNPSGYLAALDRLTQKVVAYDDTFTLDLHMLGEFPVVQDEDCNTRAHTTPGFGQGIPAETWDSTRWLDAMAWEARQVRERQLDRFHTQVVVEDRQGIAEVAKTFVSFDAAVEDRQSVDAISKTGEHTTSGPLEDRQSVAGSAITRAHTTEATEDRQAIADEATTIESTSTSDQRLFFTAEERGDWASEPWNESAPLISSDRETSS